MSFSKNLTALVFALLAGVSLSACGTTTTDRAASGALIGAGTGAAIGSLYGDAGRGALIGGLVGGVAGAAVDPCTVNLGHPVWRDANASREEYYRRCGHYPPNE
jgi:osmotically inducible lipoprotein OsmB